jgi:hypothetical protein
MIARLLCIATLWSGVATAAPADYAYTFPIVLPSGASGSAWHIDLTPAVYSRVHEADLGDIEVFNAAGHAVPLARVARTATPTSRDTDAPLAVLALPATTTAAPGGDLRLVIERDADGRLRRVDAGDQTTASTTAPTREWLLDASTNQRAIDRLVLDWDTPKSGVVARFGVEASDDLQGWRTVGSGSVLALEQEGARLERRDIVVAGVRAKYLRLRRLDDGVELVGLRARARNIERDAGLPARVWLDATLVPATSTDEAPLAGVTRYAFALPAPIPVEAARIELADDNALARIALLARSSARAERAWTELARTTAFRLRSGDETLRNDDLDLARGMRLREFRIESPTALAGAPHLAFAFVPERFVFLAEGDGPFTLAVGSARTRRPDYPIDAALASLRANLGKHWQPPAATLGDARIAAGDAASQTPRAPTPWRQWLLWGVLVLGAAVVVGFSLTLLRGARDEPRRGE